MRDAVLHGHQQGTLTCAVDARLETHNLQPHLLRHVNPKIFKIFAGTLRDLFDGFCVLRNPEMEPL